MEGSKGIGHVYRRWPCVWF